MADAQQLAQAIQQAVQAALQQQGQDQQNALQQIVQQLQPAAAQPAAFARAPALANNGIINYSSREGAAIFKGATESLTTKISVDKLNVSVLLSELKDRSNTYGWNIILNVPVNGTNMYLLEVHGMATTAAVNAHVDAYIHANNREAQNDYQLLCCLKASADETTTTKMSVDADEYTRPGANPGNPSVQSGICYLHVLLQKGQADTRSVAAVARGNITKLSEYIIDPAKYDIAQFNAYVKMQLMTLSSRGETSTDTLYHLFMAYTKCPDEAFKMYILHQKDQYEDGTRNYTPEELMRVAEQKYKNSLITGSWNKLSEEQEQIIALRSELDLFKKTPRKKTTNDREQEQKKRPNLKKDKHGVPIFEGSEKWRNEAPKPGEPTTKEVNGKTYYYCLNHKYWCGHPTSKCSKTPSKSTTKVTSDDKEITASLAQIHVDDVDDNDCYQE